MQNLLDCAIVTTAELLLENELFHIYIIRYSIGKIDTRSMKNGFPSEVEASRRITKRRKKSDLVLDSGKRYAHDPVEICKRSIK